MNKLARLVLHHHRFMDKTSSNPYETELAVSQAGGTFGDMIDTQGNEDEEEEEDFVEKNVGLILHKSIGSKADIIDLHKELLKASKQMLLHDRYAQTSPVSSSESLFDWDLSDRTDIETQTVPAAPSRLPGHSNSQSNPNFLMQDAIVQTDQRLVFLLRRETAQKGKLSREDKQFTSSVKPMFSDASCQTRIEVQEIGVQVNIAQDNCFGPHNISDSDEFTFSNHYNYDSETDDDFRDDMDRVFSPNSSMVGRAYAQSDASFQVNLPRDAAHVAPHRPDISSPVGHVLQKSLHYSTSTTDSAASRHEDLIHDSRFVYGARPKRSRVRKVDVAVQTGDDLHSDKGDQKVSEDDEANQESDQGAVPSPLRKYEIIGDNPELFDDIDDFIITFLSKKRYKSLKKIVKTLVLKVEELYEESQWELLKIRAFFRWVTDNIEYNGDCMGRDMSTFEILRERCGVGKHFVKIFSEMCEIGCVKTKHITGFAKGYSFEPGKLFVPGESLQHDWNVVFVADCWRPLDCTWGAGKTDEDGNFTKEINEHFFLTDPDEFIYTHFPYNDEADKSYAKWQLLTNPVTLETFNTMPHLTAMFFEYSLRLGKETQTEEPILFGARKDLKASQSISQNYRSSNSPDFIEIQVWGWEPVRYKYKFYLANEMENDFFNNSVLCYVKGRHRKLTIFRVAPPEVGVFHLKIYAKPEEEIETEHDTLDHVATFVVHAVDIPVAQMPWPRSELPWGMTDAFADTESILILTSSDDQDMIPRGPFVPIVQMIGDKTARVTLKTPKFRLLCSCHIYDSEGNELVVDKDKQMKYTVLLNKSGLPPSITDTDKEETSLMPFIQKKEFARETQFLIDNLPKPGYYKLQIFGNKRPKKRGKIRIPLIATVLVDYQITPNKEQTKFQGSHRVSLRPNPQPTQYEDLASLKRQSSQPINLQNYQKSSSQQQLSHLQELHQQQRRFSQPIELQQQQQQQVMVIQSEERKKGNAHASVTRVLPSSSSRAGSSGTHRSTSSTPTRSKQVQPLADIQ